MASVETCQAHEIGRIKAAVERDGCVIVTGLLAAEQLSRLQDEVRAGLEKVPSCHGNFFGFSTKRMSGLMAKSAVARDLALLPPVLAVMDEFLLRSCREYQLNLTQAIQIFPGEPAQIMHHDNLLFPFESREASMVNCMWALDDFTRENGATLIAPGSHRWEKGRTAQEGEIVAAEMSAGSTLIYVGGILHGGGANRAQHPRTGLIISYCLGWLRQAENQYLAVPPAQAATFPPRLQRLLGYFVHQPNLGCVEGQDPILLLQGQTIEGQSFNEFLADEVQQQLADHRSAALEKIKK